MGNEVSILMVESITFLLQPHPLNFPCSRMQQIPSGLRRGQLANTIRASLARPFAATTPTSERAKRGLWRTRHKPTLQYSPNNKKSETNIKRKRKLRNNTHGPTPNKRERKSRVISYIYISYRRLGIRLKRGAS